MGTLSIIMFKNINSKTKRLDDSQAFKYSNKFGLPMVKQDKLKDYMSEYLWRDFVPVKHQGEHHVKIYQ